MKKVLVIIEKSQDIGFDRNALIHDYVELKKNQGYQIEVIGDSNSVLRGLLDEQELWGKEITSAQADVMFDLNRYERVIYMPDYARSAQDILAYDPNNLDKNMIFYNIGNMTIVNQLTKREEALVGEESMSQGTTVDSKEDFPQGEAREIVDKPQAHANEEGPKPFESAAMDKNESNSVVSEDAAKSGFKNEQGAYTDQIEEIFTAEGTVGDDFAGSKDQVADNLDEVFSESKEDIKQQMDQKREQDLVDVTATKNLAQQSVVEETKGVSVPAGFDNAQGDYTDNIEEISTAEGTVGDDFKASSEEVVDSIQRVFPESDEEIKENIQSATQGALENLNKVSTGEILSISSEGSGFRSQYSSQGSSKESDENTGFVLVDKVHHNQETPITNSDVVNHNHDHGIKKNKKISIPRRLWLIAPWAIMALMMALNYDKITWIPFVMAVVGLICYSIPKKSRGLDKTPEWLSVLMTLIALLVGFYQPNWILAIAYPLSAMGIVLFAIVSMIEWEE